MARRDRTLLWDVVAGAAIVLWLAGFFLVQTAPVEMQMGIVQKIFYVHVPSANAMYIGWTVAAVGSLIFLLSRSPTADAWSVAGAEVGTLFATIVLVTGPLWGRKAWGVYWTWDPRLTSTLLTTMIYTSFLSLRSFGSSGDAEKRFAAALAVIGFPLLFLIKFSVQKWSGQHPIVLSGQGGGIDDGMKMAFGLSFAGIFLLTIALMWLRMRLERLRQVRDALELELARAEEDGDSL